MTSAFTYSPGRSSPNGWPSLGRKPSKTSDFCQELLGLLAVVNSSAYRAVLALQLAAADAAARSYEVGVIQRTPIPHLTPDDKPTLATLAHRAWSLKRSLDTR